ncbi:MarR family transcriptional regulator [Peribacillus sp. FSL H8-0477]|uniref:MarR family winged helix-turn-helix transcriptional regulator n=1 Tax=Peribacillus sp. FSL H8-0477 TaxID=2921388 RepID=UPI0030FAF1A0
MNKDQVTELIHRYTKVSFIVNRMAESLIKDQLSDALTNGQFYMLRYIQEQGTCTSSNLAEAFFVNKSAITAIISRLKDKGLINRVRNEDDRRVVYLTLSEKGQKLFTETETRIHLLLENFITEFNEDEISAFITTYEKLSEILVDLKQNQQEELE